MNRIERYFIPRGGVVMPVEGSPDETQRIYFPDLESAAGYGAGKWYASAYGDILMVYLVIDSPVGQDQLAKAKAEVRHRKFDGIVCELSDRNIFRSGGDRQKIWLSKLVDIRPDTVVDYAIEQSLIELSTIAVRTVVLTTDSRRSMLYRNYGPEPWHAFLVGIGATPEDSEIRDEHSPRKKARSNKESACTKQTKLDADDRFDWKKGSSASAGDHGLSAVAGMDDLKKELSTRLLWILRNEDAARRYGLRLPTGALLYGPPGTGKTFIARHLAEELGWDYVMVKESDLGSSYMHETSKNISLLFAEARRHSPSLIFIDEIDSMAMDRSIPEAEKKTGEVNTLLSELSNTDPSHPVFLIAATNRLSSLDEAILRPGRLELHFEIGLPDADSRAAMLRMHLEGRPLGEIDYARLSTISAGLSAAQIEHVTNETALRSAIKGEVITQETLETCIREALPARKAEETRRIGYKNN